MEEGLIKIHTHPHIVRSILNKICNFYIKFIDKLVAECGNYLDFISLGDDFAGQRGLLISPHQWRKFLKPLYEKLFTKVKEHGLKIWFHACGTFREVLPDLVDMGLDVWETIQIHLPGNDPSELKKEFGRYITFAGGINTQEILPNASPKRIRREVREVAEILGHDGGYICGPDHRVQSDVPVKNLLALYNEATKYNSPHN